MKKIIKKKKNQKKFLYLICRRNKEEKQNLDSPEFIIGTLHSLDCSVEIIRNSRIALYTNPIAWILKFLNLNGQVFLVKHLHEIHLKLSKTTDDLEKEFELIKCLHAIMNCKDGINAILDTVKKKKKNSISQNKKPFSF